MQYTLKYWLVDTEPQNFLRDQSAFEEEGMSTKRMPSLLIKCRLAFSISSVLQKELALCRGEKDSLKIPCSVGWRLMLAAMCRTAFALSMRPIACVIGTAIL